MSYPAGEADVEDLRWVSVSPADARGNNLEFADYGGGLYMVRMSGYPRRPLALIAENVLKTLVRGIKAGALDELVI